MNITVNAKKVRIESASEDDVTATLIDVDESELLSGFSANEKLESIDWEDIMQYIADNEADQ